MCGLGALGIYLLKYGFEKVIFNDINPEMTEALKGNLKINGIDEGYEIVNGSFEDLEVEKADLCVIDAFPGVEIEEIIKNRLNKFKSLFKNIDIPIYIKIKIVNIPITIKKNSSIFPPHYSINNYNINK